MAARGAAGASGPLQLSVEQQNLVDVAKALKSEADGKELRRDLVRSLRRAAGPVVVDLRAAARAIPSSGANRGPSLRDAIARSVSTQVRLGGKRPGVVVVARKTPQVRGFADAGRRFNRPSFRHPVFGNQSVWVGQVGAPRWFEGPIERRREEFRREVVGAVEDMAERLAARARSS